MDHHVGDLELAQIEHAADHVAVVLLDDAVAVQEIDGAAQFLARRQDRLVLADRHADAARAASARATRSRISTGPSTLTTQCIGRATSERDAVGRVDRDRSSAAPRRTRRRRPSSRPWRRSRRHRRTRSAAGRSRATRRRYWPRCCRTGARRAAARAREQPVDDARRVGCRASPAASCGRARRRSAPSRCRKRTPTAAGSTTTTSDGQPVVDVMVASISRKLIGEEGAHVAPASTSGATKACADAARQDEGELAALHLLVLRDQVHQRVGVRHAAGDVRRCGRQADRREMRARRARRRPRRSGPSAPKIGRPAPCRSPPPRHAAAGRRSRRPPSSAWPKVWPRLSSARSPVSRSSRATIAALARQLAAMACSRAGAAGEDVAPVRFQPGEERGIAEQPVFGDLGIAGAEFARAAACRAARCRRAPGSAGGRRRSGSCRARELMPVLPPTEESTCASSVVGTCTKSRPRRTIAAAKPARSPITPPPSATTRSPRSMRAAISASQTRLERREALRALARRHDDRRARRCRRRRARPRRRRDDAWPRSRR